MKNPFLLSRLPAIIFAATLAAAAAQAATPAACPPYTFVGRIMDAAHVAFDDTNSATLRAYSADNKLLNVGTTFFREDSTRNYALQIPMASSPAPGYAVTNDVVSVTATDPSGRIWSAVIDPAKIGTPGTVSEVDIVLAEDADGDGIDDALLATLLAEWENSDFWDPDADYDPNGDSDGDGISDLQEKLLGTNPFNAADSLAILEFTPSPVSITFVTTGGRSYAVEQASSLSDSADWTPVPFSTSSNDAQTTRTLISTPSSRGRAAATLYLFPTSSPVFFRLAPR